MRIFTFTLGAIFGAYVAQNYNIGDVKTYSEQEINKILDSIEYSSFGSYQELETQRNLAIDKVFERFMNYDKNIENKEEALEELENYQYLYIDDLKPGDFVRYFNTKIFYNLKLCLGGIVVNNNWKIKG